MDDESEQDEMPQFVCRLPIPDEIVGASRLLLQQMDIIRQEIAFVYRHSNQGRRALSLSQENSRRIDRLYQVYWMGYGAILVVLAAIKFLK